MRFPRASLALLLLATAAPLAAGQTGTAVATYEVTFDATWSAATHPGAYPSGAHFSPLIGATHRPDKHMWRPGELASAGMEEMAELGGTGTLTNIINATIASGVSGERLIKSVVLGSPGSTSLTFQVTDEFHAVSLVTMLAPSPDWFVGTDAVSLLENGDWVEETVVQLLVWDAGTDSGATFTSFDADTVPQIPIALQTGGPFTGADPIGTFTFRRQAASIEYGTCTNPAGSLAISGAPTIGASFSLAIDDPGATMPNASLALLAFSQDPDPAYPCGRTRANWGLAAPGATGELLQTTVLQTIPIGSWSGAPVPHIVDVPNDVMLVGIEFYAQGALVKPGVRVGLTTGIKMTVGP